jgi:carbamoyltransferase
MTDVFRCGPAYSDDAIEAALEMSGYQYQRVSDPARAAAEMIHEEKIVGWFQGRSEFGPRALGHRSILANPKVADIKDRINARVKFREEFRPFAPSVVEERARDYFDMGVLKDSPYMTVAVPVLEARAHEIPGVVHVNLTARVQTVSRVTDPLYHRLISEFGLLSGTPVVVNTSFNIRGQPIVETPLDAIGTFAACGLDAMFLGHYMVAKESTRKRRFHDA